MPRLTLVERNMESLFCRKTAQAASLALLVVAVVLPVCGCGKSGIRGNAIRGSVQLDGKPLECGSIRFTPIQGTKARITGGPIKGGRYELSNDVGPVAGGYKVEIRATRKTGKKVPAPFARPGTKEMVDELEEAVAPEFNFASKLTVEVKASDDNVADFQVASK